MSQTDTIAGLGARTDHVALAPLVDPERLSLTSEERAVLRGIGRVAMIGEAVARSGLPESRAIAVLLSLRVKGAIVPARVTPAHGTAGPIDAAMLEQVDLEPERRREILELERRLDRLNHFEVLGVSPAASSAEVKKAYHEGSRRFHPDRYFNKNLGSFRLRVERIFRRLSEANAVLSDEARRAAYVAAHPELRQQAASAPGGGGDGQRDGIAQARDAERRARFARHPYLLKGAKASDQINVARAAMAKGDFAAAVSELEHALQLDARNLEAKKLLDEARSRETVTRAKRELEFGEQSLVLGNPTRALEHFKNASRLDPASATAAAKVGALMLRLGVEAKDVKPYLQRAAELDPKNPQYRFQLAQVHLDLGMKSLGKRFLEETLKLDPDHAEAKAQLKKLRWSF